MVTDPSGTTTDWRLMVSGSPESPNAVALIGGTYHLRSPLFTGAETSLEYNRSLFTLKDDLGRNLPNFGPVLLPYSL